MLKVVDATCRHGFDLSALSPGQRAAVIHCCELGLAHGDLENPQ